MSIYTKKAIMDSFVKMLSQKSFDKITIKDIIEDCGLNRSTFYYYYEDIYALLEDVL
ncbi:MAG: TetR/AcrR family transcriptional regulator, partial [[Clostridium] leptum]